MKTNIIKHIYLIVILAGLSFPALQHVTGWITETPLKGDFMLAGKPTFTWNNWFTGEFQPLAEKFTDDHYGFRNFFVRLGNQIDFTVFGKANSQGVIAGKEGYLYEYDYIRGWKGDDFIGQNTIDRKMRRFRFVQDRLKEKNIDLVFVLEPSKARILPQFIPSRYGREPAAVSNYSVFRQKALDYGINLIDYNQYFMDITEKSPYPLYPQFGIHWSNYGMWLVADSLVKYMENLRGIDMPDISLGPVEVSDDLRDTDFDAGSALNLMFQPGTYPMAYPKFSFEKNEAKVRPKVLVVADSYYWNIFNTGLPKNLFGNEAFWYFNALIYPDTYFGEKRTSQVDLRTEVESKEVVFLMVTERFLYKHDWNFIENVYKLYAPQSGYDLVWDIENQMRLDETWFSEIVKRAVLKKASLEKMITSEAQFIAETDSLERYAAYFGLDFFKEVILKDKNWTSDIRKKAEQEKMIFEVQLEKDADYVFKEKFPAAWKKYHALNGYQEQIRRDPAWMAAIEQKAQNQYLTVDEMIRADAEYLYNQQQPELSERETKIREYERLIRADEKWLSDVKRKAEEKNISLDEMIRLDAEYMTEQEKK